MDIGKAVGAVPLAEGEGLRLSTNTASLISISVSHPRDALKLAKIREQNVIQRGAKATRASAGAWLNALPRQTSTQVRIAQAPRTHRAYAGPWSNGQLRKTMRRAPIHLELCWYVAGPSLGSALHREHATTVLSSAFDR